MRQNEDLSMDMNEYFDRSEEAEPSPLGISPPKHPLLISFAFEDSKSVRETNDTGTVPLWCLHDILFLVADWYWIPRMSTTLQHKLITSLPRHIGTAFRIDDADYTGVYA
jgi:hypothetical protein